MFSLFKRRPRGPEIWEYPEFDALCRSGAAFVRGIARMAVKQRGVFRLCISAAPNVLALCRMLPHGMRQNAMEWSAVHLFWAWEVLEGDAQIPLALERTRQHLLETTPVPEKNLHPIPLQQGVDTAIACYEQELEAHFRKPVSQGPPPWDMLLLDVNADGSLGALAPDEPALDMPSRWVAQLAGGALGLTLHALEGAENALLLATGRETSEVVAAARTPDEDFKRLPAGGFSPRGRRVWLTDLAD